MISMMFWPRALIDGCHNYPDFCQARDGRLSLIKRRLRKRLLTSHIGLHRLHAMTSLASMESLVFWVQTVANSANVNHWCYDVCSSASFSSDVNSDAACICVEHECPSSTL